MFEFHCYTMTPWHCYGLFQKLSIVSIFEMFWNSSMFGNTSADFVIHFCLATGCLLWHCNSLADRGCGLIHVREQIN